MYEETKTHAIVTAWPTDQQYDERYLLAAGDLITLVYKLDSQLAH